MKVLIRNPFFWTSVILLTASAFVSAHALVSNALDLFGEAFTIFSLLIFVLPAVSFSSGPKNFNACLAGLATSFLFCVTVLFITVVIPCLLTCKNMNVIR
jgi:hypothetical protein